MLPKHLYTTYTYTYYMVKYKTVIHAWNDVYAKQNIKIYGVKLCKVCNSKINPLIIGYSKKRFCSIIYRGRYKRFMNPIKKIALLKPCLICGVEMRVFMVSQKYCSSKCIKVVNHRNRFNNSNYYRRFFILKRDNFSCVLCGVSPIVEGIELQVDHIFPRSLTKLSVEKELPERLMTLCVNCNLSKGNRMLDEDVILKIIERNKEKQKEMKL